MEDRFDKTTEGLKCSNFLKSPAIVQLCIAGHQCKVSKLNYLKSEVELAKRSSHLRDEKVHPFTLLEGDDDVRSAFFGRHLGHDLLQWERLRQLLHHLVKRGLYLFIKDTDDSSVDYVVADKHQLSQMNPRDALPHAHRAVYYTEVDARYAR